MADPIHSSSWTGDIPEPTYVAGQSSVTTDYQRLLRIRQAVAALPQEMIRLWRLSGLLLLSPLALVAAYWVTQSTIPAASAQDFSGPLCVWGLAAILLAASQLRSRSLKFLALREGGIAVAVLATVACAIFYVYAASMSYRGALPSATERTFEIFRCHGSCKYHRGYFIHQRADGTTVEGEYAGPALPYGRCALVQRLAGEHGFTWVRVLERSQAGEQLNWPIRREDCFGNKPVSSLRG